MTDARSEYSARAGERSESAGAAERGSELISRLRLGAGLSAAALGFFVFGQAHLPIAWMLAPVSAFVALVVVHSRVLRVLHRARRSERFYREGLARVEDRWMGQGEQGDRFRTPGHVFADDIDLFGEGSLYELLCTARTRAGEDALAGWLLEPAEAEEAAARQQAVEELADRIGLREELALEGEDIRAVVHPESLAEWATAPPVVFPSFLPWLCGSLSAATIASLIGAFAWDWGRIPISACALVQLSVALTFRRRMLTAIEGAELPAAELHLLAGLLRRIENEPGEAALLQRMKRGLTSGGQAASVRIERLETLAERLEWKNNAFFKPFASMLMWSTQLAFAVERWRSESGRFVQGWIRAGGEFEALSALAAYRYEHPEDVFPELLADGVRFEADELAHPLIARGKAVANDVRLDRDGPLVVISGSNMSGKSTLLRAVGLNNVLAWAGAPVRARRLSLSRFGLGASIRVQDSLQDGRSRFYAEIVRLRQVVDLTRGPIPLLFLLDELLSGTNSHDRRIGAAAIVKGLIERGACGLMTTHDLALAHIAEEVEPAGRNMHFSDTMRDGELHFDYRLKPGVVERSNALELMRSVGLDV